MTVLLLPYKSQVVASLLHALKKGLHSGMGCINGGCGGVPTGASGVVAGPCEVVDEAFL